MRPVQAAAKEFMMRILAFMMRILAPAALALGTIIGGGAAHAQTYGTDYPVCLKVYGPATYYECRYTTMAQCQASASGRSAQCLAIEAAPDPVLGTGLLPLEHFETTTYDLDHANEALAHAAATGGPFKMTAILP